MKHERVVFDTNVLISALLSTTSTPAQALEAAITGDQLIATSATLRELMTKLLSAKFDRYVSRERRDALLLRLAPMVEVVEVVKEIRVSRDPNDDSFWRRQSSDAPMFWSPATETCSSCIRFVESRSCRRQITSLGKHDLLTDRVDPHQFKSP